jgi:transcriptional regulator with XRE-family HTH domain
MQLKDRFRQARLEKGLSVRELARKADMSFTYISGIENGRSTPSLRISAAIAEALDMSLLDLLDGVDFAGEFSAEEPPLPPGLRELAEDEQYAGQLDEDWLALLRSIQLRGQQPATKEEWLWVYLSLRWVFGE